jgi:hypothetical protein
VLHNWDKAEPVFWLAGAAVFGLNILGWTTDPFEFWTRVTKFFEDILMDRAILKLEPLISDSGAPEDASD